MVQTGLATANGIDVQRSPWRALPVVMVGTFMAILDTFIVLVAAPTIQADLHATSAEIQLILAGYQLTYAVALITSGRLGDLLGRKRLFLIGMIVFTLASVACAVSPGPASLIAARLIQGIGAAVMFPQVFSIIQVLMPGDQRPKALGVLGAVIGLSTIGGQLIGGLLIAGNLFHSSWRPVFWVNVPIGIVAIALAVWLVPESRAPQARRLDIPGVVALTVALALLVVPIIEGRQYDWPAWAWVSLGLSVPAFVVFILVERRVAAFGGDPLISLNLFRERSFAVGIALVLVSYAGLNSFFLVLSLTLQDGLGNSALKAGLVYTPEAITFFFASLVAGRLTARYGARLLQIGAIILTIGYASTVFVAVERGSALTAGVIIPTLILQGLGGGMLLTPLFNTILARVGPAETGMASGVLSTAQQVGGSVGVAIIGVLFFDSLTRSGHGGPEAFGHALAIGVSFNVVVSVIAAILVFSLPRPARQTA
jgi:EmrB/QacA subfamily drug resistance transporter